MASAVCRRGHVSSDRGHTHADESWRPALKKIMRVQAVALRESWPQRGRGM